GGGWWGVVPPPIHTGPGLAPLAPLPGRPRAAVAARPRDRPPFRAPSLAAGGGRLPEGGAGARAPGAAARGRRRGPAAAGPGSTGQQRTPRPSPPWPRPPGPPPPRPRVPLGAGGRTGGG